MKVTKVEREVLSVGRVLFESLLLVVSVVLGFVVSEWGTHAREREQAATVRRSIALEVADNIKLLGPQASRHYAAWKAMGELKPDPDKDAFDVWFGALHQDLGMVPLKRAAWDTAVSSGTLRLLDHDLVERYSEIYVTQEQAYDLDRTWLRETIYRPENYDPKQQTVALATLRGALGELAGEERYLLGVYRQQLPYLEKVADQR